MRQDHKKLKYNFIVIKKSNIKTYMQCSMSLNRHKKKQCYFCKYLYWLLSPQSALCIVNAGDTVNLSSVLMVWLLYHLLVTVKHHTSPWNRPYLHTFLPGSISSKTSYTDLQSPQGVLTPPTPPAHSIHLLYSDIQLIYWQ